MCIDNFSIRYATSFISENRMLYTDGVVGLSPLNYGTGYHIIDILKREGKINKEIVTLDFDIFPHGSNITFGAFDEERIFGGSHRMLFDYNLKQNASWQFMIDRMFLLTNLISER